MYELERLVEGIPFEVLNQERDSDRIDPCLAAVVAGSSVVVLAGLNRHSARTRRPRARGRRRSQLGCYSTPARNVPGIPGPKRLWIWDLICSSDRNGRVCRAQIPAHGFAIDPQLARNSSLQPFTIGQAVNRCLQAHFEDVRHAPIEPDCPSPMELFCFP